MENYCRFDVLSAGEKLLSELEKGRRSGENENWLDAEEVFRELKEEYDTSGSGEQANRFHV